MNAPQVHTNGTGKSFLKKAAKLLLYGLLGFVLLIVGAGIWIAANEEKIKSMMIEAINKELKAEIKVGKIDLVFWKHFPLVALEFEKVLIPGNGPTANGENLLDADNLFVQFNLWDILSGNYTISRIELRHGTVHVRHRGGTFGNFDLLKNDSTTSEQPSSIALSKIILDDISLIFEIPDREQAGLAHIHKAVLSGNFKKGGMELNISWEIQLDELRQKEEHLEFHRSFEGKITLSEKDGDLHIPQGRVQTGSMRFDIKGFSGDTYWFDLQGKDLDIQSFLSLLPDKYADMREAYQSKGRFTAQVYLSTDQVRVELGISNGEVKHEQSGIRMENISLSAQYLKEKGSETISITQLIGSVSGDAFQGKLLIPNLSDGNAQWELQGRFDLTHWTSFIPQLPLQQVQGQVELHLAYSGPLKPEEAGQWTHARGEAIFQDVSFSVPGFQLPVEQLQGQFEWTDRGLFAEKLEGRVGRSDVNISGELLGLFNRLSGGTDPLKIQGNWYSRNLYVDELTEALGSGKKDGGFQMPDFLALQCEISVDQLIYKDFTAKSLQAILNIRPDIIVLQNALWSTCSGSMALSGRLIPEQNGFRLQANGNLAQIDVPSIFRSFGNFGQNKLQAEHLAGDLSGSAEVSLKLDGNLKPDVKSTQARLQIRIVQGRLSGFEPLQALSGFIREESLKDIRFETLENEISIRDEMIVIPSMDIRSSALNLVLSGTHSFTNEVDYRFNLLLKDLLAAKFKKRNKQQDEFGEITEEEGGLRLFIKMSGPADNPKMAYDMASVIRKIPEDLRREVQETKKLLREEFGLFARDSSLTPENPLPKRPNNNRVRHRDDFEFE